GEKEWFPFFLSFSGLVVFSNSGCHRFAAAAAPSKAELTCQLVQFWEIQVEGASAATATNVCKLNF
ncbi:MAG: hypothetical protein ACKESB_02550, partial [Candidatus Hodgkinia cicadicola]